MFFNNSASTKLDQVVGPDDSPELCPSSTRTTLTGPLIAGVVRLSPTVCEAPALILLTNPASFPSLPLDNGIADEEVGGGVWTADPGLGELGASDTGRASLWDRALDVASAVLARYAS